MHVRCAAPLGLAHQLMATTVVSLARLAGLSVVLSSNTVMDGSCHVELPRLTRCLGPGL